MRNNARYKEINKKRKIFFLGQERGRLRRFKGI